MDILTIHPEQFASEEMLIEGTLVRYRAARDLAYVARAVCPDYQKLNLFVPEAFFQGRAINGYTARTAPVFVPNGVSGYRACRPWGPGIDPRRKQPNCALRALAHGYVVACPGVRGRELYGEDGRHPGAAPACAVDLKAVVRFLRHNAEVIPGDMERIVADGVSAGGGLAALLGSSGNAGDYASALTAAGAAETRDDIFASVCYCPVTNLGHIDEAFEWMFSECSGYIRPEHFGADMDALPTIPFSEEQRRHHEALAKQFPAYLNSLDLKAPDGQPLTLDENGAGSFSDHLLSLLQRCAQEAFDRGEELSRFPWLTVENKKVRVTSLASYASWLRRVKPPVGYDALAADSDENELFDGCHFSRYGLEHDITGASMAAADVLKKMDPMAYLGKPDVRIARHWRFRYGVLDRGSSPAIALILALRAIEAGADADFAFSWGVGHTGNHDLPELFAWIDRICKRG